MSEGTKGYSDVDWVERIHRSLHAAGVFDPKRHTACDIDALAAQRDEARQEVERLKRENQRLTDMAGAAQSQLGYWGVKVYPNDIARGIADLAQERDKCRLDAQSQSLINEELRAELASLRQQQGKGEGDAESTEEHDLADCEEEFIHNFVRFRVIHGQQAAGFLAIRLQGAFTAMDGMNFVDEEASRAT